ncbi:MAG: hypothetical protein IPO66_19575 [Rhodanobacteraceae bacterium]|nr:hypothetical protein [Rhodanobacteraceae bacterium]
MSRIHVFFFRRIESFGGTMSSTRALVWWWTFAISVVPLVADAATTRYQARITQGAPVLYYQFNESSGAALNHGSLGPGHNASYLGSPTRQAATLGGDTVSHSMPVTTTSNRSASRRHR